MRAMLMLLFLVAAVRVSAAELPQDRTLFATPIVRIVVDPERFKGKRVRTIGFLAIDAGRLRVFPSRDSFIANETSAAFELALESGESARLAKRFNRRYVEFFADFSMPKRISTSQPLGEFKRLVFIGETDSKIRLTQKSTNELYLRE